MRSGTCIGGNRYNPPLHLWILCTCCCCCTVMCWFSKSHAHCNHTTYCQCINSSTACTPEPQCALSHLSPVVRAAPPIYLSCLHQRSSFHSANGRILCIRPYSVASIDDSTLQVRSASAFGTASGNKATLLLQRTIE